MSSLNRKLMTAAAGGLTALLVAVGPSFAAPKPHNALASIPALAGVVAGGTYTASGSGFQPGELVVLNLAEANGCCSAVNIYADASGAFSYSGNATAGGAYSVRAAELVRGKWTFVAAWNFSV